jgi:hypothetical protein
VHFLDKCVVFQGLEDLAIGRAVTRVKPEHRRRDHSSGLRALKTEPASASRPMFHVKP